LFDITLAIVGDLRREVEVPCGQYEKGLRFGRPHQPHFDNQPMIVDRT